MKYIIEICVAIDIAIFGIAYPIIITEVNKIGDKFNSTYLSDVFRSEWVSYEIKFRKLSIFQIILTLTIFSFLFLIIDAKPWFEWDNIFINNSAELLVLFFTVILIISFLEWVKKVNLYNGKPIKVLTYIISKYDSLITESEKKKYLLRTINDFAYHTIKTQDSHLQKVLTQFYWKEFDLQRKDYVKKLDILKSDDSKIDDYNELLERGVEYTADLYDLVYRVSLESVKNGNYLIKAIEYNCVSGWWLLGKGYDQIKTSELTYRVLWSILKLNLDYEQNIRSYWSKAHQYGNYAFRVDPQYDLKDIIPLNQKEIDLKNEEKTRFLEFNYTVGSLLLQQKKYNLLNYIFKYSSSSPPDHLLLPQSMSDIFYWYNWFNDNPNLSIEKIEFYFTFPELDNYGVSHKIKYWVCSYICLLYIRQFSLHKYYTFQNLTGYPNLPDSKQELKKMQDNIPYFKKCLGDIFQNENLLKEIGFVDLIEQKNKNIDAHLINVEKRIAEKLNYKEESKILSHKKIKLFKKSSEMILKQALLDYKPLLNDYNRKYIYDPNMKFLINGVRDVMLKSAFVEKDIPHFDYDTNLAELAVNNSIKKYIPSSFTSARTERYLVYKNNILSALNKLLDNNSNLEDFVIIGFNVNFRLRDKLAKNKYDINFMHSTQPFLRGVLYVLRRNDLPALYKKEIGKEYVDKYDLKEISSDLKIKYSILEINKNPDIKSDLIAQGYDESSLSKEPMVQVMLSFIWLILWKKDRRVVQIKISDPSLEQGIESDINELTSFEEIKKE